MTNLRLTPEDESIDRHKALINAGAPVGRALGVGSREGPSGLDFASGLTTSANQSADCWRFATRRVLSIVQSHQAYDPVVIEPKLVESREKADALR